MNKNTAYYQLQPLPVISCLFQLFTMGFSTALLPTSPIIPHITPYPVYRNTNTLYFNSSTRSNSTNYNNNKRLWTRELAFFCHLLIPSLTSWSNIYTGFAACCVHTFERAPLKLSFWRTSKQTCLTAGSIQTVRFHRTVAVATLLCLLNEERPDGIHQPISQYTWINLCQCLLTSIQAMHWQPHVQSQLLKHHYVWNISCSLTISIRTTSTFPTYSFSSFIALNVLFTHLTSHSSDTHLSVL